MGKIFGLLACIGTAALVSGCVKAPQGKNFNSEIRDGNGGIERETVQLDRMLLEDEPVVAEKLTCVKREESQKISEAAEAAAITTEIIADVQNTNVLNAQCSGKDVLTEGRVYEASGSVIVTGPTVAATIFAVEVESDRTCAKIKSESSVADVSQTQNKSVLVLEADGDIQLPVSNSLKLNNSINVGEGKNLIKVKYFKCDSFVERIGVAGAASQICEKKTLVAEKELVLNVAIKKNVIEGVRTEEGCPKKEEVPAGEKPKTDGQV